MRQGNFSFTVNGRRYRVCVYAGAACWTSFAERQVKRGYLGCTGVRDTPRAAWLAALRLVARDAQS